MNVIFIKIHVSMGKFVMIFNYRAKPTLKTRVTENIKPGVIDIAEG